MPKIIKPNNVFTEITKLLKDKRTHRKQLLDGHVYLYKGKFLMASFFYVGGCVISSIVLNTKKHIGHTFTPKMLLNEKYLIGGDILFNLLKEKFPKASECNILMKHAYEYNIIEWLLNDPTSMVDIIPSRFGIDISIVNIDAYTNCSFRYLSKRKKMTRIWLRYNTRVKTVRIDTILLPRCRWSYMDNIVDRTFLPIVD